MYQLFNVFTLVKIFTDQLSRKALVEDKTMVILIKAIHIHAHEAEEFRVDELLSPEDAYLLWKDLTKIHFHLFWLFI